MTAEVVHLVASERSGPSDDSVSEVAEYAREGIPNGIMSSEQETVELYDTLREELMLTIDEWKEAAGGGGFDE